MFKVMPDGGRLFDFTKHNIRHIMPQSASEEAWLEIESLLNVELTAERLIKIHRLDRRQFENAKKQSKQIRYCILQAREYYDAAKNASMATRPLQLYYSCLAFAQAEILLFGTGEHSLDRLRQKHSNHGLDFHFGGKANVATLDQIKASVRNKNGSEWGTFGVWHSLKAQDPIVGKSTAEYQDGGAEFRSAVLLSPSPYTSIPDKAITLLEIMQHSPHMYSAIRKFGLKSSLLRAHITINDFIGVEHNKRELLLSYQPGNKEDILASVESFKIPLSATENFELIDRGNSYAIRHTWIVGQAVNGIIYPNGVSIAEDLTYLHSPNSDISEFGYIYLGTYILGMLCRYFPDIWMNELEKSSSFAQLCEQLIRGMAIRAPVCMARNLGQTIFLYSSVNYTI